MDWAVVRPKNDGYLMLAEQGNNPKNTPYARQTDGQKITFKN